MSSGAKRSQLAIAIVACTALLAVGACHGGESVATRGDFVAAGPNSSRGSSPEAGQDRESADSAHQVKPDYFDGMLVRDNLTTDGPQIDSPPTNADANNSRAHAYSSDIFGPGGSLQFSFSQPDAGTGASDWTEKGAPRDDYDFGDEDLPTIHEVIDNLHLMLDELHRNNYNYATPLGALCWSVWEASRSFFQQKYGDFFSESVQIFEEIVAERQREGDGKVDVSPSLRAKIEEGSVGRTTETPEYPNDYSIIESLETVAVGPIRARALDESVPAGYLRLAQDFFAIIDHERSLPNPQGFDLEAFSSDYLTDPGGVEELDCQNHLIGNVGEPTTTTTLAIEPDEPIPGS